MIIMADSKIEETEKSSLEDEISFFIEEAPDKALLWSVEETVYARAFPVFFYLEFPNYYVSSSKYKVFDK